VDLLETPSPPPWTAGWLKSPQLLPGRDWPIVGSPAQLLLPYRAGHESGRTCSATAAQGIDQAAARRCFPWSMCGFLFMQRTKLAEFSTRDGPREASLMLSQLLLPSMAASVPPATSTGQCAQASVPIFFKLPSEVAPRASVPTIYGSARPRPVCCTPLSFFSYINGGQCAISVGQCALHIALLLHQRWPVCY
jgi:hypothetical protein